VSDLAPRCPSTPRRPVQRGTQRSPREPHDVPRLRGLLHLLCCFVALPAGLLAVARAQTPTARIAAVVYAIGLTALFGVSAAYHRGRWSAAARSRMKRLDHATIFVMIAGSYTPLCVVTLGGRLGLGILIGVWAGAGAGMVLAAGGIAQKRAIGLMAYIVLGWVIVVAMPALARNLTTSELVLILVGGGLYTLGGVVLGLRWPNPFPATFGFHEVWHVMVVAAAACHYVAIVSVLSTAI